MTTVLKQFIPELGRRRTYSNQKAQNELGLRFIPAKEAIVASTESLIALGEL